VGWPQIVFGVLLVAALLFLSLFYGAREVLVLRRLPRAALPEEEWRYERGKARRRLVSCGLTLLLAVLFAVALAYLEAPAQALAEQREGLSAADAPPFSDDQRHFLRLYGGYWIAVLLVLLVVVVLAALDLWATRRFGLRQHTKLQADRRAMIERQALRLREQRNGHV
jgi:hypothetical protein